MIHLGKARPSCWHWIESWGKNIPEERLASANAFGKNAKNELGLIREIGKDYVGEGAVTLGKLYSVYASDPSPRQGYCAELVPILYPIISQWGQDEIIDVTRLKGRANCSVSGDCDHFWRSRCTRTSWYSHPSQALQASSPRFSTSFLHDGPFLNTEISFSLNFVYENTIHSSISSLPRILLWFHQPNAFLISGLP